MTSPSCTCSDAGSCTGSLYPEDMEVGELVEVGEEEVAALSDSNADGTIIFDDGRMEILGE